MQTQPKHTTFKELKRRAEAMGYTVEDDKENTTLYVHAPDGMGWENGHLTSLLEVYGSWGDYTKEWRQTAINEMADRITAYPPSYLAPCEDECAD